MREQWTDAVVVGVGVGVVGIVVVVVVVFGIAVARLVVALAALVAWESYY